jgi:hypothetical protein
MNKRFLALAGVATVLAVGTYAGLNIVKPYKHEEPKVADVTSPDQVFGASVDNPEAHANEAAAAPAAAGAAPAEAAAVQPADTAVQPASPDQGGAAPAPTPATASASDSSSAPLVPADASGAAPAPAPSTETAAAEPAAAPEPAPEPAPAPAAEPAPAPAAAPAEKPKKAAHHVASSSKSSKSGSSAKVWWPAEQSNKLSLVYAGPASFKKAVVLMFNGAFFKPDGIDANLKVTDKAGKAVSGSWEIGENNRRMLVFTVPAAGTYKVSVATGLTDSKGHKPGKALSGPVVVK